MGGREDKGNFGQLAAKVSGIDCAVKILSFTLFSSKDFLRIKKIIALY